MAHLKEKEIGRAALDGTAIGSFVGSVILIAQPGATSEIGQYIFLASVGMGALRLFPYYRRGHNAFVEKLGIPENKI